MTTQEIDYSKLLAHVQEARRAVYERLETCPLVFVDKIVPKFLEGSPAYPFAALPQTLQDFLFIHREMRQRDFEGSRGGSIKSASWYGRPKEKKKEGRSVSDRIMVGKDLDEKEIRIFLSRFVESSENHIDAVNYSTATYTDLDLFTLFAPEYKDDYFAPVEASTKRFTEQTTQDIMRLGKNGQFEDLVRVIVEPTGLDRKIAKDYIYKNGVAARFSVYANEVDAALAKAFEGYLKEYGYSNPRRAHYEVFGRLNEIDSSIDNAGRVDRRLRGIFGSYFSEFIKPYKGKDPSIKHEALTAASVASMRKTVPGDERARLAVHRNEVTRGTMDGPGNSLARALDIDAYRPKGRKRVRRYFEDDNDR
jgi:hypothetical protein